MSNMLFFLLSLFLFSLALEQSTRILKFLKESFFRASETALQRQSELDEVIRDKTQLTADIKSILFIVKLLVEAPLIKALPSNAKTTIIQQLKSSKEVVHDILWIVERIYF